MTSRRREVPCTTESGLPISLRRCNVLEVCKYAHTICSTLEHLDLSARRGLREDGDAITDESKRPCLAVTIDIPRVIRVCLLHGSYDLSRTGVSECRSFCKLPERITSAQPLRSAVLQLIMRSASIVNARYSHQTERRSDHGTETVCGDGKS